MPNGTILLDLVFAKRGVQYLRLIEKYDKPTASELVENEDLNHGNAHTSIKQLEDDGYLNRYAVSGEKPIELSEKGKKVLEIVDG